MRLPNAVRDAVEFAALPVAAVLGAVSLVSANNHRVLSFVFAVISLVILAVAGVLWLVDRRGRRAR